MGNEMEVQIRWADVDANRHLRHSVYYDFGAAIRIKFLNANGLTAQWMEEFSIGPVLFREEALFKREILAEDIIKIDLACSKAKPDFSRWSIRHHITKIDGTLAAIINVDGAWIDLKQRKLAKTQDFIVTAFEKFPRTEDFTFL